MSNYCIKAKCKARKKVIQMWLEVNRPWPHLGSLCCNRICSVALKVFSILSRGRYKALPTVVCSHPLEAWLCQFDFSF